MIGERDQVGTDPIRPDEDAGMKEDEVTSGLAAPLRLGGRIAPDRIRLRSLPAFPAGVVERFRALGPATAAVADALDQLGIAGAIGARKLQPNSIDTFMVGRALTMRNIARPGSIDALVREGRNLMGDMDAHLLAEAGDVLVIEGVTGCSNMGGVAARVGRSRNEAGAVVAGGVRDISESRSIGYPLWYEEATPVTGKWRVETVEINGTIHIYDVTVSAGDLVVADANGVCFVPFSRIEQVLILTEKKVAAERSVLAVLDKHRA